MSYQIRKVDVWAVDLLNRPGMLARVLEMLAASGASLEFLVARRVTENTSRTFVAPLKGARQIRAAREAGLAPASGMHTLRLSGPDRPGLGAVLTRALADAGLNVRGVSIAAAQRRLLAYFAFRTAADAAAAQRAIRSALRRR